MGVSRSKMPHYVEGSFHLIICPPDTLKTFCRCLILESSTVSPHLTVKHLITMSMLSKEMFCLLSIRLVLAHMQLVMISSVSHVQQEYKHEMQQHKSRFASGLNTSDIGQGNAKTEWVQDILLNMTNMRKGLKNQTWRDNQLWQNHCSQEKLSFPNWVLTPYWAFAASLFLTYPPTRFTPPLPLHLYATAQPSTHPLHAYAIHIFTYLFTLPPTYLLIYAMLTLTNENNANADIAFTWLALN